MERQGVRSQWSDVPVGVRDELDRVLGSPVIPTAVPAPRLAGLVDDDDWVALAIDRLAAVTSDVALPGLVPFVDPTAASADTGSASPLSRWPDWTRGVVDTSNVCSA